MTSWVGELMFWVGDRLNRLEQRPKHYCGALFLLFWLLVTLLAYYAGLDAGLNRRYFSWGGAVTMGFLLSCIMSVLVYLMYLRLPSQDDFRLTHLGSFKPTATDDKAA